jgi:hypothetical protein
VRHIGNVEIEAQSMVVVYDARTGRIIHAHYSITHKGGKHPDRPALERDALEELSRAQPSFTAKTAVLHVDPTRLTSGTLYSVDAKKVALVEQRPDKRGKGKAAAKLTGVRLA